MSFLGIDYGQKFCGIAWSPDGVTVLPLQIIKTEIFPDALIALIAEKKITTLVWGMPKNIDGEKNPLGKKIQLLGKKFSTENFFIDEKLTSRIARENTSSSSNRIDDLAAMEILKSHLNTQIF